MSYYKQVKNSKKKKKIYIKLQKEKEEKKFSYLKS
jgi:hypothetical protein